jgi:putative thioredoxin
VQADQARRREAARAALADRLAAHEAENAADADDLTTADREFADGQVRAAFERLLGLIQETSGEERDRARLRLLDLFDASPPQDPRVAGARASLSRLLF